MASSHAVKMKHHLSPISDAIAEILQFLLRDAGQTDKFRHHN
uniref:Uncharacterized protein n=1 Tax=Anguilla anguilla TaxID=7936 RepID=A0A0E9Q4C7_ANGAN